MQLLLNYDLADGYSSNSQICRVMTESWANASIYCPNCGNNLTSFKNNKPVADFYCQNCLEEYEMKSKNGVLGKKVVDGAYKKMIERLNSSNNPNFFFLTYSKKTYMINDFLVIPKYFFVEEIIEKRKPLSDYAKRPGWVGCNIVLEHIPQLGKIFYIRNGKAINKELVLNQWEKTTFIKKSNDVETKGWLFDILRCIEKINKNIFFLEDLYVYEDMLRKKHPMNNNIKAKIRQQLQILRDKNILSFVGKGKYEIKR